MSQVAAPPSPPADALAAVALAERLVATVGIAVRGKQEVVELAVVALLAGGHLLVEDLPGTGKTLLAKSLATAIGGRFGRVERHRVDLRRLGAVHRRLHRGEVGRPPAAGSGPAAA